MNVARHSDIPVASASCFFRLSSGVIIEFIVSDTSKVLALSLESSFI